MGTFPKKCGTTRLRPAPPGIVDVPEQWLVLVTCRDENHHVELLEGFRRKGVECKALVS